MEFRFDAAQEYQLAAIEAVCGLLEGQPPVRSELVVPDLRDPLIFSYE